MRSSWRPIRISSPGVGGSVADQFGRLKGGGRLGSEIAFNPIKVLNNPITRDGEALAVKLRCSAPVGETQGVVLGV